MGKTKAERLGFMVNLANNGLAFAVPLGTTALAFPDYVAAVEAAVDLQTAADALAAEAKAAMNTANTAIEAQIVITRAMANAGRASTMSDADLALLGIARRSDIATPVPVPDVAPIVAVGNLSAGVAVIKFTTPGASGPRQRAVGSVGVEVSLRPVASASPAEAGVLSTISRTGQAVNTSLLPAGPLKVCARFVTQRGLKGPWSDTVNFSSQPV